MKAAQLTIRASILIAASREQVWDYTQDYTKRPLWDAAVLQSEVLQTTPIRIVKVTSKGRTTMTFLYKLYDRPNKTTLLATDIHSPLVVAAGGSWNYEEQGDGTLWTQTNTLQLRHPTLTRLWLPVLKLLFEKQTKTTMCRAKKLIERSI